MDDRLFRSLLHRRICVLLLAACALAGCALTAPRQTSNTNALVLSPSSLDTMWERAVSVLHRNHFMIARESKLEGIIETEYRAGSNLLEFWHPDSIGHDSRTESTVQSIRRKVTIAFQQRDADQIMLVVNVLKEIEDVPGPTATYAGGATFPESNLFDRDLDQVVGQAGPSRWLPRGRDTRLESRIVSQIQSFRL